jgi:transposase
VNEKEFYQRLLGVEAPWRVSGVELDLEHQRIEVAVSCERVEWVDEAGRRAHVHGYEERRWRHLDTCQCQTLVKAKVPRVRYENGSTKMVRVPWAEDRSRFTLMFEAFAIRVLLAGASLKAGCEILHISWDQAQQIMGRAVGRGLERRKIEGLRYVGLDEKSFGHGQSYISVLCDLDQSRVLEVSLSRNYEATRELWLGLSQAQRDSIEAVAMDMWDAYLTATHICVPQAAIVYDKFHVSQELNQAVDLIRRKEHQVLMGQGDLRLGGTRQWWLRRPENLSQDCKEPFERLVRSELKAARAWMAKQLFECFWQSRDVDSAREFFLFWYGRTIRSRIPRLKAVARMLRSHLERLLNYILHPITNAVTEGFNSKIQALRHAARGFRSFANYRVRILFCCGKLSLMPEASGQK